MKIRNGFVSNSSSSSFILYGIRIPNEEVPKSVQYSKVDIVDDGNYCLLGKKIMTEVEESSIKELTADNHNEIVHILSQLGINTDGKKFSFFAGSDYN